MAKINEQKKVELLEEAVLRNDVAGAKALFNEHGTFELTARALGYASLCGSAEMVRELIDLGATFRYEYSPSMKRKYGCGYSSRSDQYPSEYALLSAYTGINAYIPSLGTDAKTMHFGVLPENLPAFTAPDERATIAELLYLNKDRIGIDPSRLLFYSILWGCRPVAGKLLSLGTELRDMYVDALTKSKTTLLRNETISTLVASPEENVLYALDTFGRLLKEKGLKVVISQKAFEDGSVFYNADVIRKVFSDCDTAGIDKVGLLKKLVQKEDIQVLEEAVDCGLLTTPATRDNLIELARDSDLRTSLAWLMDYKNRTADIAKETANKEKREAAALAKAGSKTEELKRAWSFKKLEDNTLMLTSYKGEETSVTVPDRIGKNEVTVIGKECFKYDRLDKRIKNNATRLAITDVVIPEGIKTIAYQAFDGCKSLETVTIPASAEAIGTCAFYNCESLKQVTISKPSKLKEIRQAAFSGCKSLDNFVIPDSVTEIGESAFYNCHALTGIVIPGGVTIIRYSTFNGCRSLENVTIPDSVTSIDDHAFLGCKALKELPLPKTLTDFHIGAIYDCSSLKRIVIPESVKTLGPHFSIFEVSAVIEGRKGSCAIEEAKRYGLECIETED